MHEPEHRPVRQVAIVDLWTDTNRGDEALQRSLIGLLRDRYPAAQVTGVFRFGVNELAAAAPEISSTSGALDEVLGGIRRTHYAEANLGRHTGVAHQVVSLWSFVEAVLCIGCFALLRGRARRVLGDGRYRSLAAIRDADVVVWKGKNFRDHQGLAALTRALTLGGAGLFAGWLNPNLHCVNASFWPIRRGPARRVYRAAFRRCRSLTVRDPSSLANARDLLGDRMAVLECPDLSYELLGRAPELAAAAGAPLPAAPTWDLALTVTAWGDPGEQARYAGAVVAAVERLAGAGVRRVVVVPQVTRAAEDNTTLVDTLLPRLRAIPGVEVEVLDGPLSVGALLGTYGRCRLLLGARMHSCMFARAVGTPFVALSYDTGPKWEVLAGFWPGELLLEYGAAPTEVADACAVAWARGPELVADSEAAWQAGIAGVASNLDGLDGRG
jgi:colanic acid/amylovoran biosynthesis protein